MEIKKIPLSLVIPSPMNPRKTFDEGELQELADNIEKQGLLQPVTVRPIADKKTFDVVDGKADFYPKYELICGERRFRAFSKLSDKWSIMDAVAPNGESYNRFSDIPAIIREMDDEEAFEAMITENLQRKDVDPIEEAFAFGQLIERGKSAEEVADRFGKSIRFVQDRVKLNNLIPELMLVVREGEMPISSAMIIAKLTKEDQQAFLKRNQNAYQGFSKANAQIFVNNLFMTISRAIWSRENQDFEGGCGCKCSECPNNTENHGCLFWEMKSEEGEGKCTNREKFSDKTVAYILSEIDKRASDLVRRDEPLAYGKTVVGVYNPSYASEMDHLIRSKILEEVESRGYEVVDPYDAFDHRVTYDNDDPRTQEFIKEGKAYRCLNVFDRWGAEVKECCFYIKKGDEQINQDENGVPFKVKKILDDLANEERGLKYSLIVAGGEALKSCKPKDAYFCDDETALFLTCMLTNNYSLCETLGMETSICTNPDEILKWVKEHRGQWQAIKTVWMFQQIGGSHANLRVAEPYLDNLGDKFCPEDYQKAQDKVLIKFGKYKAKAEKQLKGFGYGLDGKPLAKEEIPEKEESKSSKTAKIFERYRKMKAKQPDAVLLFRVGDFYECINEDSERVADVLNITVTTNGSYKLAGFPHHALDTYLPMLVRAGVRVAICEDLEEPETKK